MAYQTINPESVEQDSDDYRLWYNLATLVPNDTVYDNTTELIQTKSGYAECILNGFYYDENKPNPLRFEFGNTNISDTTRINNVRFYFKMYVVGDGRTNMVSQTPKPNVKLWTNNSANWTYDYNSTDEYLKLVDEETNHYYVDSEVSYLNDNYDETYMEFTCTFNNLSISEGNKLTSAFFNDGFGITLEFDESRCMVEHRIIFESVYCVLNYGEDSGIRVTSNAEGTYKRNTLNTVTFTIVEDTDVDSIITIEADGKGLYINPYDNVGVENGHPLSTDDPYKVAKAQTYGNNTVTITLNFIPTEVGDCSFKVTVNEEITSTVFNFSVVEDTTNTLYDMELGEDTITFYGNFTSDTGQYVTNGTPETYFEYIKKVTLTRRHITKYAYRIRYGVATGKTNPAYNYYYANYTTDVDRYVYEVNVELWNKGMITITDGPFTSESTEPTTTFSGGGYILAGDMEEFIPYITPSQGDIIISTNDDSLTIPLNTSNLSNVTVTRNNNNPITLPSIGDVGENRALTREEAYQYMSDGTPHTYSTGNVTQYDGTHTRTVKTYTPSSSVYDSLLKIDNIGTTDVQGVTTKLFSINNVEVYRKYSSGTYRLLDPHFYSLTVSNNDLLLKTFEGRYYEDNEYPNSTIQDIKSYKKDYHDKVVVHITPLRNEYDFKLTSQGMSNTSVKTNRYYYLNSPNKYIYGSVLNFAPATYYMQERTKLTMENLHTGVNDIIHYFTTKYYLNGEEIPKTDAYEDGELKEGVTTEIVEIPEEEAYNYHYWVGTNEVSPDDKYVDKYYLNGEEIPEDEAYEGGELKEGVEKKSNIPTNDAFIYEYYLDGEKISEYEAYTSDGELVDGVEVKKLLRGNVRKTRALKQDVILKYESVISVDFSKCHFYLKKPKTGIMIEKPVPYLGAIRLHRCHKADVTNTTSNTLIREVYQNRQYYGKKGDWSEEITMTLRMPWRDMVTLQGHVRADMPIPIDILPMHPDGDPLNHRGWAEIESTGAIRKINDSLYECHPKVTYLTHELIGRFAITQDPNRICDQDPPVNMLKTHEYWEDDREVLNMSSYLNFTSMPIGDGRYKGVYTVADGMEYIFDLKDTVSSIGKYCFRWRNILPALGTTAHDDNNWQTAIRVLGASDNALLFEYLYKDFKHFDGDELLNECNVRVLHKNPLSGLLDTINYSHMNLDFDEVGAEVSVNKTNTYIEIPEQDQKLFEKGRNLYFTLRDDKGYGIPNKNVDVNIINNSDEIIYSIPALTDLKGNRDVELNLESGQYTAQLSFDGDDKYNPCSIEYYFKVDLVYRQGTELAIYNSYGGYGYDINNEYIHGRFLTDDDRPIAGEKIYVSVYQNQTITKTVKGKKKTYNQKVTISDKIECTTTATGWYKAKVNLLGVQAGTFTAEAVYKGTDYYQRNSYSRTFTMHQWYKHKTTISTSDQKYEQGTEYNFVATLKDHKGKPIEGETLRFGIHNYERGINQRFAIKTDKKGQAKIPVMFNSGNHQIDTYYYGSSRHEYSPCRNTNKITTYAKKKETTNITAYLMHIVDYVNNEFNAWLKDSKGKGIPNVPIEFEIYDYERKSNKPDANGEYSGKLGALREKGRRLTDASGQAEWNINLGSGDYIGWAIYKGNNKYAGSQRGRAILISRPPVTHKMYISFLNTQVNGYINISRDEQTHELTPIMIQLTAKKEGSPDVTPKGIDGKIMYYPLSGGDPIEQTLVNTTITSDDRGIITVYPNLGQGKYRMEIETYGASIDKDHNGVFETVFAGNKNSVMLNVTHDCYMDTLIEVNEASDDDTVYIRKDSGEPVNIILKGIDEKTGNEFVIPNKRISVTYKYTDTVHNKTVTSSPVYITTDEYGVAVYKRKMGYSGTLMISYAGDVGYDSCSETVTVEIHNSSKSIPTLETSINGNNTIRFEALPLKIKSYYVTQNLNNNGSVKHPTANTRVRIQVNHSNPLIYSKSFVRYTNSEGIIDFNLVFPQNGTYTITFYCVKNVNGESVEEQVTDSKGNILQHTVTVNGSERGNDVEPVDYLPSKLPTSIEFVSPDLYKGAVISPIQHTVTEFPYLLKARVTYTQDNIERVLPNQKCRIFFTLTNGVIEEYVRYTDTDGVMTYESLPLSYGEYAVTVELETDDTYDTSNINTTLIVTQEAEDSYDSPSPAKAHLQKRKGQVTTLETPKVETYDGIEYGSTAELFFNGNLLSFYDYGLTQDTNLVGSKISLTDIELPKDDKGYKLQFLTRYDNDVDNTVDELLGTLQVEITDDKISKLYQQFYENLIVSPAPLYEHRLMFTRESEDGTLYYYDVTSNIDVKRYRLSPFLQYKGGVNLETIEGVSLFDLETGVSPVVINNGLVKAEFNKRSGFIRVSRWDERKNKWNAVRWLQVNNDAYKMELLHYSTDKISVMFGNTTWTVLRGRPWIEIKHETEDIKIIGNTNKVYAEISTNDTNYALASEVNATSGVFNAYNALNYFPKNLNITENIRKDNFTVTGGTVSTPVDISLINETCLKVDATDDVYSIELPKVQRPVDDEFTFLIDRLKLDNVDNIEITCKAYDKADGKLIASDSKTFDVETNGDETVTDIISNGRLNTGFRAVFNLDEFEDTNGNPIKETTYWNDGVKINKEDAYTTIIDDDGDIITELKNNIEIKEEFGDKYEDCNFVTFEIKLNKNNTSQSSYVLINHLMLSDGDNLYSYTPDNRLDGISNQEIRFENTFYANFYNSFEDYGMCVLRPYKDNIYIHKLPKSKCSVIIPYNRYSKKYDSPSFVCLEYVFTHDQTTSLLGDEY